MCHASRDLKNMSLWKIAGSSPEDSMTIHGAWETWPVMVCRLTRTTAYPVWLMMWNMSWPSPLCSVEVIESLDPSFHCPANACLAWNNPIMAEIMRWQTPRWHICCHQINDTVASDDLIRYSQVRKYDVCPDGSLLSWLLSLGEGCGMFCGFLCAQSHQDLCSCAFYFGCHIKSHLEDYCVMFRWKLNMLLNSLPRLPEVQSLLESLMES